MTDCCIHRPARGFSLLEVTIALSLSGILLSGLWQLMAVASQQREAAGLSSQTMIVAAAAKDYVSSSANAVSLMALPGLAALGNIVQVRITDADPGDTAVPSLQGGGFLPAGFINLNSYGQAYALFVRREDGGTLGVADAGDRLIGLLLTTGGSPISDSMGTRIVGNLGGAGGFIYSAAGTLARGAAGAWSADFATDWSGAAAYASAGHVAALVNLLPTGMGIGGGTSGVRSIDDLTDARTDYNADLNIFMGANAGDAIASGGQNNTGVGIYALRNVSTGDNNIALGLNSGLTITTGNNNIAIGANASFTDGTLSNQLNIGNKIYGDLSTGQLRIGSATLTTGIGLDDANTSASRLATGNVAQRPACTAALEGAQRFNSQTQNPEFCTGGAWIQPTPAWTSVTGTPPTPNPGSGYFVLTAGQWDGNLGGILGANAKCLADLTANDWMNKATAVANGQLVAAKVRAFMSNNCMAPQIPLPLTTYYFARSGDPAKGGANMSTDGLSHGPYNNYNWAATNYFGETWYYWANLRSNGGNWYSIGYCSNPNCNNWTSNSSGDISVQQGYTNSSGDARWSTMTNTPCNLTYPLVCIVDP